MSTNTLILYDKNATNENYVSPVATTDQLMKDTFNFSFFIFVGTWCWAYTRLGRKDNGIMKKHLLGFTAGFFAQKIFLNYMLSK